MKNATTGVLVALLCLLAGFGSGYWYSGVRLESYELRRANEARREADSLGTVVRDRDRELKELALATAEADAAMSDTIRSTSAKLARAIAALNSKKDPYTPPDTSGLLDVLRSCQNTISACQLAQETSAQEKKVLLKQVSDVQAKAAKDSTRYERDRAAWAIQLSRASASNSLGKWKSGLMVGGITGAACYVSHMGNR